MKDLCICVQCMPHARGFFYQKVFNKCKAFRKRPTLQRRELYSCGKLCRTVIQKRLAHLIIHSADQDTVMQLWCIAFNQFQ